MRQLLKVWSVTALVPCWMLAVAPAQAGDGVVLVGCDLFSRGGPTVDFVQSSGIAKLNGKSKRRLFVSGSGFRSADFEGRPCSEVLFEVVQNGLVFQAMNVFGQDEELALWFFHED